MADNKPEPVVLDLAPLPRDQVGPFLLLGLEKDADREAIEANWARRVIWARKGQIRLALEDINWAREIINDPERRVRHDVSSLNPDTLDGALKRLAGRIAAAWQPVDSELDLRDYTPAVEAPDAESVRAAIVVPEVAEEVPAALGLLRQLAREPATWDPWAVQLSEDTNPGSTP
jgi:hypothetical protein